MEALASGIGQVVILGAGLDLEPAGREMPVSEIERFVRAEKV